MPVIGKPKIPGSSKFSNISIRRNSPNNQNIDKGELLNKIAGLKNFKNGVKFVDKKKHNQIGKNEFLQMLTHQLANQDPLNPMDQKKFAADLAQFAQLEQLTEMNKALAKQGVNAPQENKFYGASFLGKEAMTKGTTLEYVGDGERMDIPYFLPKDAKNIMIRLYDSRGQLIVEMNRENLSRGNHIESWDGVGMDGAVATKDTYTVNVRAWDEGYNHFQGETKSRGKVTGVRFENGETVLTLDGKKSVFLRDVESFSLMDNNRSSNNSALKRARQLEAAKAFGDNTLH